MATPTNRLLRLPPFLVPNKGVHPRIEYEFVDSICYPFVYVVVVVVGVGVILVVLVVVVVVVLVKVIGLRRARSTQPLLVNARTISMPIAALISLAK